MGPASRTCDNEHTLRRWAKPKYWASRHRQATALRGPRATPASVHRRLETRGRSDPARPARKHPKALSWELKMPGTFSQTTRGPSLPRWASKIVNCIRKPHESQGSGCRAHRPAPWRRPATENDWHGVPPAMTCGVGDAEPAKVPDPQRFEVAPKRYRALVDHRFHRAPPELRSSERKVLRLSRWRLRAQLAMPQRSPTITVASLARVTPV